MSLKKRLVIIGIGGASCSGKTLLAKHIRRVLPNNAVIVHQDDFCPPEDKVPYSSKYPDLQDWDDPETCIQWPEFRNLLQQIRSTGRLPGHASHDHLNKQVVVDVAGDVLTKWKGKLEQYTQQQAEQGVELVWYIVDGFVLYYDKTVVDTLDVRIFLRVSYDLLKSRREERQVYVLQHPDDAAAGGVWVDPPGYFDKIVWPGYLKAHQHIFDNVQSGSLSEEWRNQKLVVLTPGEGEDEMTTAFDKTCEAIVQGLESGAGAFIS